MLVRKFSTFVMAAMLLLTASFVSANEFAPNPMTCDNAAPTYLSDGMTARVSLTVDNQAELFGDAEVALNALLFDAIANKLLTNTHSVFSDYALAPVMAYNVPSSTQIEVLGNMKCINFEDAGMVARYWQVQTPQATGYMLESVVFDELSISSGNDAIAISAEDLALRLLKPVYEPVVPTGGNGQILSPDDLEPGTNYCAGAPTSYLAVGMQAEMSTPPAMMRYVNSEGYADPIPVFSSPNTYANQIVNEARLRGLLNSPYFGDAITVDAQAIFAANTINPIATIENGPFCYEESLYPTSNDIFNVPERFMTYWYISVDMNGQTVYGWYPENMLQDTWWSPYSNDGTGVFPFELTSYHLIPYGQAMQVADDCPPARFAAGTEIQPVRGTMNLRQEPNGAVLGRFDNTQSLVLLAEPVCDNGTNWWLTERGFIAENDSTTGGSLIGLLLPAVQADSTAPDPIEAEPMPANPVATPTLRPLIAVTAEPTRPPRACNPAVQRCP